MSSNSSRSGANTFTPADAGIRRPLDVDELDSAGSELCWGDGLEPKGVRGKPPSEGGRYTGLSPECDPAVGINRS